ncbi:MAG: hypothetical protein WCL32_04170 [Planctomycetota bacterium]
MIDKLDRTIPVLAGVLTPALEKVWQFDKRGVTFLRCASVALAAEEFRLRECRWPKDAVELTKAGFLKTIPLDPYASEPLRLRHTSDGLVVFSVGERKNYEGDLWDDPAMLADERKMNLHRDVEFRLWSPEFRNQAP